ncbi:hypothetical protein ACIRL2_45205 [Embleya sp. NPDC127516]|uniref:hypothetical protein n=1 Tax=Embleya sp. NPDC127516 TaxID=3363990 RepID=UPI0038293CAB
MTTPPAGRPPPDCTCPNPWTDLVTVVENRRLRARPATTPGPVSALYLAHCARCNARYPGPWRLAPDRTP